MQAGIKPYMRRIGEWPPGKGKMGTASEMLDRLESLTTEGARAYLGDVAQTLGHRSVGALIALPALLEVTPIGGVPGVPTLLATIIAIFAVQVAAGRSHLWLPSLLERRPLPSEHVLNSVQRLRPVAGWADRHFGIHITWVSRSLGRRLVALAILALCLTVPPLELVPFASSIPMLAIAIFGLGLLFQDGRLLLLGWAAFIAALLGVIAIVA